MENIISSSTINKKKAEQEKYGKENLNNYVHSGSSFMEFTKQRQKLGIDKTETIDSKNGIDYLQKKHNMFKDPENLLNQAERNKNQEEGLADIYTKNYMKEFNNKTEKDIEMVSNNLNSSVGVLEDIYENTKRTNGWNEYGKTLENSVKLASDGENISITTIDNNSRKKEGKEETESILPQGVTICGGYIKHSDKKEEFIEHQEKIERPSYDVNSYVKNTTTYKREQEDDVNSKMYTEYLYKNSYKSYNRENEIKDLQIGIAKEEKKTIDSSKNSTVINNANNDNNSTTANTTNNNITSSVEEYINTIKEKIKDEKNEKVNDNNSAINNTNIVENTVSDKVESNYRDTSRDKEEKKEEKKPRFVHKASWYSVEEDDEEELEKKVERNLEINNRENMEEKEVYLTKEGYEKLEEELKILKTEERDNIEERIKIAKSYGDLSENSEYDEARSAQAANENKIAEIEQMLKKAKIIDEKDIDTTTVQVGNTVYITNIANNKEQKYTIVGTAEANVLQGKISNESPIAKSLLRSKSWRSNTSRSTSRNC